MASMQLHNDLMDEYVVAHNRGVRSGDFSRMLSLFDPDAVMEFQGFGIGSLNGIADIGSAFSSSPPTDELEVVAKKADGQIIVASYGWQNGSPGGMLTLIPQSGRIKRLIISRLKTGS